MYKVRNSSLQNLYNEAIKLLHNIPNKKFSHIERYCNQRADELCNKAMDLKASLSSLQVGANASKPNNIEIRHKFTKKKDDAEDSSTNAEKVHVPPTDGMMENIFQEFSQKTSSRVNCDSTTVTAERESKPLPPEILTVSPSYPDDVISVAPIKAHKNETLKSKRTSKKSRVHVIISDPDNGEYTLEEHLITIIPIVFWPSDQFKTSIALIERTKFDKSSLFDHSLASCMQFISFTFENKQLINLVKREEAGKAIPFKEFLSASELFASNFLTKSRLNARILCSDSMLSVRSERNPNGEFTKYAASSSTYVIGINGDMKLLSKVEKFNRKMNNATLNMTTEPTATSSSSSSNANNGNNIAADTVPTTTTTTTKKTQHVLPKSLDAIDASRIMILEMPNLMTSLNSAASSGVEIDKMLYGWAIGNRNTQHISWLNMNANPQSSSTPVGTPPLSPSKV